MAHVTKVDILFLLGFIAIAVASLYGSKRVADAVYELADRTIMVQCECR